MSTNVVQTIEVKSPRNGQYYVNSKVNRRTKLHRIIVMILLIYMILSMNTIKAYGEESNVIGFELSGIGLSVESEAWERVTKNHYKLVNDNERVDFMIDDLRNTPHMAYNTSVYSGRFIQNSAYTSSYIYKNTELFNKPVHIYAFERNELNHAPTLKKHFVYIEIEVDKQVLLSLHIASDDPIDSKSWISKLNELDSKFEEIAPIKSPNINGDRDFIHESTGEYFQSTFEENDKVTWGIFEPSTHYELDYVEDIEDETGIGLDIILEYYDLGYMPRLDKMSMVNESDRVLELTFQTSKYGSFNADAFYDVLDGKHDDTIDELIGIIKASDAPVLFRPNNEMNGDWCSYNAMYTHKDTEAFRAFWVWLHNRFEQAEADNVIWVWNPNWGDFPQAQWNHYMNYFPGESYVDVVGLTGYNTGTYYKAETWRSFSDIYLPMLWEYNQNFVDFPYMITEFGSSATGGNRGEWIQTAFDQISQLNIKAAVWWNHVDYDTQKGVVSRGYKFDDDPEVMEIFKDNFGRNR